MFAAPFSAAAGGWLGAKDEGNARLDAKVGGACEHLHLHHGQLPHRRADSLEAAVRHRAAARDGQRAQLRRRESDELQALVPDAGAEGDVEPAELLGPRRLRGQRHHPGVRQPGGPAQAQRRRAAAAQHLGHPHLQAVVVEQSAVGLNGGDDLGGEVVGQVVELLDLAQVPRQPLAAARLERRDASTARPTPRQLRWRRPSCCRLGLRLGLHQPSRRRGSLVVAAEEVGQLVLEGAAVHHRRGALS